MKLAALTATLTFVLDQATKLAVVQGLNLIERGVIEIVPPFLVFRMAWNRGINFGLFAGEGDLVRWFLVALSLAITAWVWRWISRSHQTRLVQISAGLLIGGALGNVIDRVVYEAVADFLNMSCCGIEIPMPLTWPILRSFSVPSGLSFLPEAARMRQSPRVKGERPRDAPV